MAAHAGEQSGHRILAVLVQSPDQPLHFRCQGRHLRQRGKFDLRRCRNGLSRLNGVVRAGIVALQQCRQDDESKGIGVVIADGVRGLALKRCWM
jgi:hypothetical protein